VAALLVVVYVAVPFLLLSDVASFSGCYLLWTAATVVTVIGAIIYTRRWKDS